MLGDRVESLIITTYGENSGPGFSIVWYKLMPDLAPCVELFYDNWAAFRDLAPLFAWLAEHDDQCLTCEQIMHGFAALGVEDVTR
jgi:hypothetical protein